MKKTIYIILIVVLALGIFTACANQKIEQDTLPPGPNRSDEEVYLHIKAIIKEVGDHSLLVLPIEGLDYIDIIHLNIGDETIINITEGASLAPGTIVYAKISTAIMESYPPQVALIEITKTEIGDSIVSDQAQGDAQPAQNYLTGKVVSISGDEYTLEVLSSSMYKGQITLLIPADVLDADMPIEQDFLIGVYVAVEKANPAVAEKLVFSEPEQIIILDDRETISMYLDGIFPQAVYSMADENLAAEAAVPFAIGLEQNCESSWSMTPQDGVNIEANGSSAPKEDGSYINYFGISIATPGEYTLEFIHESADGTFDFSFAVTVD